MALVATENDRVVLDNNGPTYRGTKGSTVLACGVMNTFTGANPAVVDCKAKHGMGAITGAVVSYNEAVAPGADPNSLSVTWSGTTLNIYRWKVTTGGAAGNPTEIASTHDVVVSYMVMGTI